MDLIETVNAVVGLQKRVLKLSANTNLSTEGQSTINDYNALASRLNGKNYALLDQTAILTAYVVTMNPVSLSTRISTDDFEEMRDGINSILDTLAAAIRTECSRRVRAIEQRVAEPVVKMLLEDIKLKSQYSEISIANMAAMDTSKLNPEVVQTENPLVVDIIEDVNLRPNYTQRGGGIRFTSGRWSGNKGAVTCVSGSDGDHIINVRMKALTTGVLNVIYLPAPGTILQPQSTANGNVPVALRCIDVSSEMSGADFLIDFMRDGNVLSTQRGVGIYPFEMCDRIRFRVTPWDLAKNLNPTPDLVNWAQNNANKQPTVSFLFEVRDTFSEADYFHMSKCVPKVQFHMDNQFNEDSFIRRPNVNEWTVQNLMISQQDKVWCQKIAMCIAAYAAKI
uniref:Intermediate capsid protein VP6 n=1 Tax=Ruddy turnstone rotavirus TaxID=2212774 RepID=A0A3G1RPG2_9REOV|nr:MAG: viral structural protein 6 [Ruddy turnstone rotavirus]